MLDVRHVIRMIVIAAAYVAGIYFLWSGSVRLFDIQPFLLPSPEAVFGSLASLPAYYLKHTLVTLEESAFGVLIGFITGLSLGILLHYSGPIGKLLNPPLLATQIFPKEALAPIILTFMGFGIAPKIVISSLICFFPVVINTAQGLKATPQAYERLMHVLGASPWQSFWRCRLPFAAPFLLASLKMCATLSVIGAIVGEFVGSSAGLGHVIRAANADIGTERVYAALLLLGLMGAVMYGAAALLERVVFRRYTRVV